MAQFQNDAKWQQSFDRVAICICRILGRAVLESRVQPAAASGLQGDWGGGDHSHGLHHSAATILLNHVGKDLREIQELLRYKSIRTTVRYTAEALSQGSDNERVSDTL
jgi:site-specific recombinase XerC